MESKQDVTIIGGGINGAIMALALAKFGFSSTIIDYKKKETDKAHNFDGRSYALATASVRLLNSLDVWDEIKNEAEPVNEIKVSDGLLNESPSRFTLDFKKPTPDQDPLAQILEDHLLRCALLVKVKSNNKIRYIAGKKVEHFETSVKFAKTYLNDGSLIISKLIVGADGRNSWTARKANINYIKKDYDQTALVCAVSHEKPHQGVAYQHFFPSGPLAILPLKGKNSSIVWTENKKQASEIMKLDDKEYMDILLPRFGKFLGKLRLVGKRFSFPLNLLLAENFISHRLALIGDAAHGVHPIAGQGLNAGLKDIAAFVQVLKEARQRGEDISSSMVLERYQVWRRFDSVSLTLTTDLFNTIFSNHYSLVRPFRNLGMGFINHFTPLKKSVIREATGLGGKIPDLMKDSYTD